MRLEQSSSGTWRVVSEDAYEEGAQVFNSYGEQGLANFHRTVPKGERALSVVVASMALGRDASPGISGVSHENGIPRYVAMSGWVGPLVRAASEEEKGDGREIVVDKDALDAVASIDHSDDDDHVGAVGG